MFRHGRKRNWPKFGRNSTVKPSVELKHWVEIEDPVHIGPNCRISADSIGRYTFINASTSVFGGVTVGRFASIAQNCQIGGAEHPLHYVSTSSFRLQRHWFPDDPLAQSAEFLPVPSSSERSRPNATAIGNDTWLGASCVVLRGVTIGDGAVVGAGAVVTRDVPSYAIVVGNPARVIRYRFDEPTIARLLAARWWDRDPHLVATLPLDNVEETLRILESAA